MDNVNITQGKLKQVLYRKVIRVDNASLGAAERKNNDFILC